jgi:DNA-binding MarR family transcriptional regulator
MPKRHVLVRTLLYLHHQLERASMDTELSPSQYLLMHFLMEEPRLASDFAAVMRLRQPSVAALVRILEDRGWIERYVAEDDRRARFVRISNEGRRVFHAYEAYLSSRLCAFLGDRPVQQADQSLSGLYDLWNDKRIERFERWANHQSARGKRRQRQAG